MKNRVHNVCPRLGLIFKKKKYGCNFPHHFYFKLDDKTLSPIPDSKGSIRLSNKSYVSRTVSTLKNVFQPEAK